MILLAVDPFYNLCNYLYLDCMFWDLWEGSNSIPKRGMNAERIEDEK